MSQSAWNQLDPRVKEYIGEVLLCHYNYAYSHYIKQSESPIEQLMAVALEANTAYAQGTDYDSGIRSRIDIAQQLDVDTGEHEYRADFCVGWTDFPDDEGKLRAMVLIECDGHNYHERTKEQAKHDKSRDRALQAAGYHVLHFTGSEIWADPNKCAEEVYRYLIKLVREARKAGNEV